MVAYKCGRFGGHIVVGRPGTAIPEQVEIVLGNAGSSELQKMKNSGNEAKKYLKTKEITFSNAADYARFARKLARLKEQKQKILLKRNEVCKAQARPGK